jgi:fatty acid synthase subunit beta, fungi type
LLTTPKSNDEYARTSGDFNPIHTSSAFSSYASLPGTITHGMYTSAAVRRLLIQSLSRGQGITMSRYCAAFTGMVLPGDTLQIEINHIAMKNGQKVLSFNARRLETGEKVIEGEAEIDQSLTTYFFTGQGSQQVGMGMDLYSESELARSIWDRADAFFSRNYGMPLFHRLFLRKMLSTIRISHQSNCEDKSQRINGSLWWQERSSNSEELYGPHNRFFT